METACGNVIFLTAEEIIKRNAEIICYSASLFNGGNVHNSNSLYYLVEIVKDDTMFPLLSQKAAAYAYYIITRHVFSDGNKRTAMACAFLFLSSNGCYISSKASNNGIVDIALKIANNEVSLNDLYQWFSEISDAD